jgi:hypothetical protein
MLSRQKTANTDENIENKPSSLKTPSIKRPLTEHNEDLPAHIPSTSRKGLRDVTNSAQKEQIRPLSNINSTTKKPSKLSKVINEEDIPEPEYAPILTTEEEASLFAGIFRCLFY